MGDKPIYSADKLSLEYPGGIKGLDELSFKIERGDSLAVLGSNGSGKSTLLYILAGLLFPTKGRILFAGNELSEKSLAEETFQREFRKKVGILFQNPDSQLFNRTVFEEVLFGPLHLGFGREEAMERVEKAIADFRLERLKERAPHDLSGGEKKRVALAAVMASDPEVILLDEPTGGLDPRNSGEVTDLIMTLAESGKTVISATNDMIAVPLLAEKVLVIGEDHRISAFASMSEVIADERLLSKANLIHAHRHRHGKESHRHIHTHLKGGHDEHEHLKSGGR